MRYRTKFSVAAALAAASIGAIGPAAAQTTPAQAILVDPDDIGGVVAGPNGPEAGVWVIAETTDLPTRYAKIVVTDDAGRYLLPDLPQATYSIWVRGYGLVDSAKVRAVRGRTLDLTAVPAPDAAAAARYYPAISWYAMLRIPGRDQFGGGSDIPEKLTQSDWLKQVKNIGCIGCHQLGQASTRTIPRTFLEGRTHEEAWIRRVQSGQSGEQMVNQLAGTFGGAPFRYYAEWTERIARGELPRVAPKRPEGLERNVVVTHWEWHTSKQYLHDLIASDRRNPTVNAYGPLFGAPEYSTDVMPILDPRTHRVSSFRLPVRDANTPEALGPGHAASADVLQPSAYWGDDKIWDTRANNHNAKFDARGRLWLAAAMRSADNPAFCKRGSDHPSARAFPLERANRQITILDPKTMQYSFVDTCFGSHHLQFSYDADDTLWPSGTGQVAGWINTRVLDETGDAARAQGWSPFVLDTNGNGRRDEHSEPNQPFDPAKDRRIATGSGPYAVMPSPVGGSIWYTVGVFGGTPAVLRFVPGSDPARTGLTEIYHVPQPGFGIRGGDIDSDGVVWASLSSGHLASFDRRKCKGPLSGPTATGDHCPEGWSFHQYPGPGFEGIGENSAESSYYTWVDQHDTFGLGRNVPMSTANLMDGLVAFKDGRMVSLRVPYPLGFYAKGFDGRIDDPAAGWKGRGLWTTSGDRTPWLMEGGKGSRPRAVHFQIRPDPLAR
jgi:hypothetical protein